MHSIDPNSDIPIAIRDKTKSSSSSITVWGGMAKANAVCRVLNDARRRGEL